MKQLFALLLLLISSTFSFAQETAAEDLTREGIVLHDAGKYEEAIAKYEAAFKADPKFVPALYEKANTLAAMLKNEEALELAKKIIKDYPSYTDLAGAYMLAGNALDDLQRSEEALKIYDEGIKRFPQVNLLYYNKALTLDRLNMGDEAVESLHKDLLLKPTHASGHHYTALYYQQDQNLVPAIFAHGTFLLLEPKGPRAEASLAELQKLVKGNASVDSTMPNTININLFMPKHSKKSEDDFSTTNMSISLMGGLNIDKALDSIGVKRTDVDKLKSAMSMAIESTEKESKKRGFAWKYYVPFFAEMKKRNFVETFCYLCFRPSNNKAAQDWLAANEKEIANFYDWMETYNWPKKVN